MNEKDFLKKLHRLARLQATLPLSHNRYTAFFWSHAWKFWLLTALITAYIYEILQGRC
jgi:hypothetical protein